MLDQGPDTPGPRWQAKDRFEDLREVLAKVSDQALVLLGPPGSGKSTLLRHHELDTARQALAERSEADRDRAPVTLLGTAQRLPGCPIRQRIACTAGLV